MKTGIAPGPSELLLDLIAASEEVGIQMMAEICQSGFGMPIELAPRIVVK